MTIVINTEDMDRTVKLTVSTLGECAVTAPDLARGDGLRRYYEHPSRANTRAFVNVLLAVSVTPARTPAQFAALPAADRARLRRAVAFATGGRKQWRALTGSHLSADERVFSVMLWRWERWEGFRRRIRERYLENQKAAANTVDFLLGKPGAKPPTVSLLDVDRFGDAATRERLATAAELARTFPSSPDIVRSLARQFDTRVKLGDLMSSMTALSSATRLTGLMGVSQSVTLGVRPEHFSVKLPAAKKFGMASIPTFANLGLGNLTGAASAMKYWTTTMEVTKRRETMLGSGSLAAGVLAGVRLPALADFTTTTSLLRTTERWREFAEAMDAMDAFERRWQSRTVSYLILALLRCCDVWLLVKVAALSEAEVEEVVLDAVEMVVSDGEFVPAMRTELTNAPLLNRSQRLHLDHLLEHAEAQEWVHATGPLYAGGLEGAFWAAGCEQLVVTVDRTDPTRPTKTLQFENMVKRLPVPQEFKTLMTRGLYGTAGNPFRHGDADDGERRQVLLGIVALAGWFEYFADRPAFQVLIERTADQLPEALKVRRVLALPAGDSTA